jgi:thiosulfate/3-mercaptopyruvate sulfurtransferase
VVSTHAVRRATSRSVGGVSPLISVAELLADLSSDAPPLVLDVRWSLGAADPRGDHEVAHIPGSVFVDLASELSGPGRPEDGRHPLPDPEVFAATATRWGIGPETAVVAYDDSGGMSAARLWWLLRWIGHPAVRVLDGGLAAWRAAGGPLESGPDEDVVPASTPLSARPGAMATVSAEDIVAGRVPLLLDARAEERYRGEVEPIDSVAGHIPGARSAPTTANLRDDATFRDPAELRARFADVGVVPGEPVAAYCGSGVTAAHELLALEVAGLGPGALYAPSWSGWIADPNHPVQR